jgi:tripartite ATP-independent transporter DctP family solute receptor
MPMIDRRMFLAGAAALGGGVGMPSVLRAQATEVRWGEQLAPAHPQVQMAERIAKEVAEKTDGRLAIQVFPGGQLGAGKDMMEAVSAGALQLTTDGAGALGAFLPRLTLIEAPYLWRDAAHMAKVGGSPIFDEMNGELVARRGMRLMKVTYYGKRHVTTGTKEVHTPADMVGFKLRVPPVDVFQAMAEAWGARATPIAFPELYLALSQGAVDGQENPLPTIQSAKLFEVQKYLVLTQHILTPRIIIANEAFWQGLAAGDREIMQAAFDDAAAWQDQETLTLEAGLGDTLKSEGMTVIEPDLELWRKPVLDTVPAKFEERWGKGSFEALSAL